MGSSQQGEPAFRTEQVQEGRQMRIWAADDQMVLPVKPFVAKWIRILAVLQRPPVLRKLA